MHLGLALISSSLLANAGGETSLDVQLRTFDEWQMTESKFCPEEPVLVEIRVINSGNESIDLSLCAGETSYRALIRIYSIDGSTVWDTDEIGRLEKADYELINGHAPILIGGPNECSLKQLPPQGTAYVVERWPQTTINGEFVPLGKYSIAAEYRWLNESGNRAPIRARPIEIIVSDDGCE